MLSTESTVKSLLRELRSKHDVVTDQAEIKVEGQQPFAVKMSACYIVCGIVIQNDKILMVRESKKSCYGLWYLPAGKMEPRETIEDSVLREVLEETGLVVEVVSLLCLESPHGGWIRMTFAVRVTGGELKTIDRGDKESLEASWFPVDYILANSIKLRSQDIMVLIRLAKQWFRLNYRDSQTYMLPKIIDHGYCKVRLLLFCVNEYRVLVFTLRNPLSRLQLPEMRYNEMSAGNIVATCHQLHNKRPWTSFVECHGVVGVEHSGKLFAETDGIRITVAMEINHRHVARTTDRQGYEWIELTDVKLRSDVFFLLHSKVCAPILA